MLLKLLGITRLFKDQHPQNAISPILVTLSGITILRKEEQPQNALSQIIFVPFLME